MKIIIVIFLYLSIALAGNLNITRALFPDDPSEENRLGWIPGETQSPIDIISTDAKTSRKVSLVAHLEDEEDDHLEHHGEKLNVQYTGSKMYLTKGTEWTQYNSIGFHFHAPSEHAIDGSLYDLEMHIVHTGRENGENLAVLGVLFEVDDAAGPNAFIDSLNFDDLTAESSHDDADAMLSELFNQYNFREKYHYIGSLTTPPYTEGVQWFVYANPVKISQAQLDLIKTFITGNNRALQDVHSRTLYRLKRTLDIFNTQ